MEKKKYNLGIDLGGTNIKVGVVDEDYNIIGRASVKTNLPQPDAVIADSIATAARMACENAGITMDDVSSVGIGTPGSANRTTGIVLYANNLGFRNTDLRGLLRERIGIDAYVENDANAAAYGEMLAGAAKGLSDVIVITLGTGVGGGIIIGGKIYGGYNFCGAELGHTVIAYGGRHCTCGRDGCFEAYCSATALVAMTKEAMLEDNSSKLWELADSSIDNIDGKTAFDAMRLGDATGTAVVDKYINYLGCGLVNMINIFQPQMVLLGGGVCKEGEYLTKPLEEIIRHDSYCIDDKLLPKLGIAKLGNDAGIIGAAFLNRLEV